MQIPRLILTILISVIVLLLLEGLLRSYITSMHATPTSSPFGLKNFIPSIVTAIVVGIPLALILKPKSFHITLLIGMIWFAFTLLGSNLLTPFQSEHYLLAVVHILGPNISAISLLLIIAYIADNDLLKKNET